MPQRCRSKTRTDIGYIQCDLFSDHNGCHRSTGWKNRGDITWDRRNLKKLSQVPSEEQKNIHGPKSLIYVSSVVEVPLSVPTGNSNLRDELIAMLEKRRKSGEYENPYAVAEIIEAIEAYGDYDTDDLHKWVQSLFSM